MAVTQRVNLQPAYLLHQRAYRDTSVILDVLTPEFGRVALVAKGVRQEKSKLKGVLRLFQPLVLSWTARGEMGTLTGAEAQGRALQLQPDVLPCGFYLNELLQKLLHQHDPHIELFSHYDETQRQLAAIPAVADDPHLTADRNKTVQAYLRHFEVSLLQTLGYALLMDRDFQSHDAIVAEQDYLYRIDAGPYRSSNHTESESDVNVSGATLLALAARTLSPASDDVTFRQAKRLMRVVLDHYLGHKPLHSRQLMTGRSKMPASQDSNEV